MLEVHCSGSPTDIGRRHGEQAKEKVKGSLAFYEDLFKTTCSMNWVAVREEAKKYMGPLTDKYPQFVEEMQGVADGAGVDLFDIVALNVRTEIVFGLFTEGQSIPPVDGCTSLAYKTGGNGTVLAQNWDWQKEQGPNLFICHISQPGKTNFVMVTEGGIIGKIGFNSNGVGICMNAIRAVGVDTSKVPVHLAMRNVLESKSREEAIERIKSDGLAGSVHLLIADKSGAAGVEGTTVGIKEIHMDQEGKVVHANNLVLEHPGVNEPPWLEDSAPRVARMDRLLSDELKKNPQNTDGLWEIFNDKEGYPAAINRCQINGCETQTLFTIIMKLATGEASVAFGMPGQYTDRVSLKV